VKLIARLGAAPGGAAAGGVARKALRYFAPDRDIARLATTSGRAQSGLTLLLQTLTE
jgi:hypothetical protein